MSMGPVQMKLCPGCGGSFDVRFFRRDNPAYASAGCGTRSICRGCEQTARDARKKPTVGRWAVKIGDTIRRHAEKLKLSRQALEEQFGWAFDRMLHEAQHAYANGCSYCGAAFRDMGHGLSDITLDILNPAMPPYYTTNCRWVCGTCNREKSQSSPDDWGAKRAAWDTWRRRTKKPIQRRLFDDDDDRGMA